MLNINKIDFVVIPTLCAVQGKVKNGQDGADATYRDKYV